MGWGKFNGKCKVSNDFILRAPKSPTGVNTCLDGMEEFTGRSSNKLTQTGCFFPFSN